MGFFTSKDLEFLDNFNTNLKRLQKQYYYTRDDLSRNDDIKENLRFIREEYSKISSLTSVYDHYTQESVAFASKSNFILSKTCFYKKKLLKYSKTLFDKIFTKLHEQHISQSQIRHISRNLPWVNMWIGLKNNGKIFENGVSLSVEQQGLLMWTKIYDSLSECAEPPEKRVVEDDDMFDGWMASQEDKKDNKKENNHDEIFCIAKTQEDIDRISNMNSGAAKAIKNQRLDYVYNNNETKEIDLPDVARDIAIKSIQLEMENKRGK